jgi:hypothetical protein
VRSAFLAVAVALAALAAACSSGPALIDYPTPKVSAPTTSTTVFDYESVALPDVPGRTTTTVDNRPGKANLTGTVTGPDGPVPMANVRVERLVEETVLAKDLVAGPDGAWRLDLVRGGRYRVRAWRAPDLAQVEPQIFYLGFDETRSFALVTARYNGPQATALVEPSPPVINEPVALSVVVTTATVDTQGIVRGTPLGGTPVQLLAGFGDWRVESPPAQVADAGGNAMWRLTCLAVGPRPLSVVIGSGTPATLTVPPCDDGTGAQQVAPTPGTTPRTTTTTRVSQP